VAARDVTVAPGGGRLTTTVPVAKNPDGSSNDWEYVNPQTVRLLPAGTPFQNGSLYEFTYLAKDPLVAGLGFAGLRDLTAFLHQLSAPPSRNS
jgi:hypothetical protein